MKQRRFKLKNIYKNYRDHIAKIFCLVMACVLWFYVQSSKSTKNEFPVYVDYNKNLAKNLIVSYISAKHVMVSIEGKKQFLQGINVKDFKAYLDVQNPVLGKKSKYEVKIDTRLLPEGIFFRQNVKHITALIEQKIKKKLKVVPSFDGDVAKGRMLGEYEINPDELTLEGPKSLMDSLETVTTYRIPLNNRKKDLVKVVAVDFKELTQYVPKKNVKVKLQVYDPSACAVVDAPINIVNNDEKFNYVLGNKSVNYTLRPQKGNGLNLDEIDSSVIYPYVDAGKIDLSKFLLLKKINSIDVTVPVLYKINNNNLEVVNKSIEKVKVTISKK